jgi:hypothetical protein
MAHPWDRRGLVAPLCGERSTETVPMGSGASSSFTDNGTGDQKGDPMARITREGFETCMAFGMASLAVAEVADLVTDQLPDGPIRDLFVELEAAHHQLRDLFDDGDDAAVHALALSVLVLADRTTDAIREEWHRPGS